jgi:hypothetical protein
MQLIQIGQPASLTIQQLIEQMAAQEYSEIEQLKQAAPETDGQNAPGQSPRSLCHAGRARCEQPVLKSIAQASVS